MTHDPLCTTVLNSEMSEAFCNCDLIARVREDERMRDDDYAYVATQSYAAALRDAIEAIKQKPFMRQLESRLTIAAIESLRGSGNPDTPLSAENPDRGRYY